MKAWLLRWLGAVSLREWEACRAADQQILRDGYISALVNLKADQEAATAELIQELNAVRNSIPATLAQETKPPVRVFRNFREFRTEIERRQPIPIERTS